MQIREMEAERATMVERQSMLGEEVDLLTARIVEKNQKIHLLVKNREEKWMPDIIRQSR